MGSYINCILLTLPLHLIHWIATETPEANTLCFHISPSVSLSIPPNKNLIRQTFLAAFSTDRLVSLEYYCVVQVCNVQEAWDVIDEGALLRRAAETKKNERSSRSHSLVNIRVRGENRLTGALYTLSSEGYVLPRENTPRTIQCDIHKINFQGSAVYAHVVIVCLDAVDFCITCGSQPARCEFKSVALVDSSEDRLFSVARLQIFHLH